MLLVSAFLAGNSCSDDLLGIKVYTYDYANQEFRYSPEDALTEEEANNLKCVTNEDLRKIFDACFEEEDGANISITDEVLGFED